jgi:glutamine amidotransferase-like uncharacterized protein
MCDVTRMQNMTLNRKKRPLIAVLFVMLYFSPIVWKQTAFALDGADVAIYNDSGAPVDPVTGAKRSGTWQDGITDIKRMLNWMGLSHEEISYGDLNDPSLDLSSFYKVLLFPGGFAYWYNYWISSLGKSRIRNFVNNGGGYFGVCAGSFFASDTVVWEGISYEDRYLYNAYGELTGYDLDLFSGTTTGPINGIAPWPTYGIATIDFEKESEILLGYKMVPFSEDVFYYGGPYFTSAQDQNVAILGNYDYNGEPALVAFTYGSGRVVLTGPHLEIDVDSETNGEVSDWELSLNLFKWIIEVSDCLAAAADLSIRVPCAEYNGNPYGFLLDFYPNSDDPSGYYWKLVPGTLMTGEGSDCLPIGTDLSMPMSCVSYNGMQYGFTLDSYSNPYDPSGLYWKMDASTLELKSLGKFRN